MTAPGHQGSLGRITRLAKAQLLGIAISDVEDAVLGGHEQRTRNTRAADWLVRSARLTVAYSSTRRVTI
jgi:hypothetical protein